MNISRLLIGWYGKNSRELPWRSTSNPYYIWISEIILQQTRVDQGLNYYEKFIRRFPDIKTLASANLESVLKSWQGLGYYTRARNLHQTAKTIVNEKNGIFPDNYAEIIMLKGIGKYTAGAIASIAFKEPVIAIDGNAIRVISRLYGVRQDVGSPEVLKTINALAGELLPHDDPGSFNQALMDFGALQCTPKNPLCEQCPLNNSCIAYQENLVQKIPLKTKKTKIKKRYFYYFIFKDQRYTILEQRKQKDIWHGLFQFPLAETPEKINVKNIPAILNNLIGNYDSKLIVEHISDEYAHQLSHQKINARFIQLKTSRPVPEEFKKERRIIPVEDIQEYPVPRLIERYLLNNPDLFA